jgi:hypothetical protein
MFSKTFHKPLLALAAGILMMAHFGAARADTEHSTHIACYASVSTQCKAAGCSKADYDWGYDQCDQYYSSSSSSSSASPKRPRPSGTLSATNNKSFRTEFKASLGN